MTTDRETLHRLEGWLEEGRTRLPDHVLDAVFVQLPSTPQRGSGWRARGASLLPVRAPSTLVAAAVVVVAVVGWTLSGASEEGRTVASASPSASPTGAASPTPPASSMLPASPWPGSQRRLPGTSYSAAGVYGWEGGIGEGAGMHRFSGASDDARETTELVWRVGPDCLASPDERPARPIRIAGWDGVVVEPYEPPVTFGGPEGDEVTRAYILDIQGRELCVFLTWNDRTTAAEREAAEAVMASMQAVPVSASWIRVTFTLDEGWDTG